MPEELGFKLVLLGDGRVGKTSIRRRFMGKHFVKPHLMTIGADFSAKTVEVNYNDKAYLVKHSIWDIAGQDSFKMIRRRFFQNANALLLVFDITNKTSFDNLLKWLYEAWEVNSDMTCPIMIIGNKIDLELERVIKQETALNFMNSLINKYPKISYCGYIETSALTGQNIEKLFMDLANVLIEKIENY